MGRTKNENWFQKYVAELLQSGQHAAVGVATAPVQDPGQVVASALLWCLVLAANRPKKGREGFSRLLEGTGKAGGFLILRYRIHAST